MNRERIIHKKIGEILIERGLISEGNLNEALARQKLRGGYVSQHLIALGFVSERAVAECLACQYNFGYLPLKSYEISPGLLRSIPFKLIDIYSFLPIDKIGESLSVVMVDPLNDGVIDMLKQITGSGIEVFISTYSEVREAIAHYFPAEIRASSYNLGIQRELSEKTLEAFIQSKGFVGVERRRHARKNVDYDLAFFAQGQEYRGKVKNLSYSGMLFNTAQFIPIENNIYANIVCRIATDKIKINAVVQVVRVEKIVRIDSVSYDVAGFFNFITEEDRSRVVQLI